MQKFVASTCIFLFMTVSAVAQSRTLPSGDGTDCYGLEGRELANCLSDLPSNIELERAKSAAEKFETDVDRIVRNQGFILRDDWQFVARRKGGRRKVIDFFYGTSGQLRPSLELSVVDMNSGNDIEATVDIWATRNGINRDIAKEVTEFRGEVPQNDGIYRLKVGNFTDDAVVFYRVYDPYRPVNAR